MLDGEREFQVTAWQRLYSFPENMYKLLSLAENLPLVFCLLKSLLNIFSDNSLTWVLCTQRQTLLRGHQGSWCRLRPNLAWYRFIGLCHLSWFYLDGIIAWGKSPPRSSTIGAESILGVIYWATPDRCFNLVTLSQSRYDELRCCLKCMFRGD